MSESLPEEITSPRSSFRTNPYSQSLCCLRGRLSDNCLNQGSPRPHEHTACSLFGAISYCAGYGRSQLSRSYWCYPDTAVKGFCRRFTDGITVRPLYQVKSLKGGLRDE